ncbi:MAG: hypothetical protein ACRC9Z_10470 [Weissella confusa]
MSFYIDAREILDEFQMTQPVTLEDDATFESYDPVLSNNNAGSTSAGSLTQLIQAEKSGGFDNVDRAVWYTTHELPLDKRVIFADKRWTIVRIEDYVESSFSNLFIYDLQAVGALQQKEYDEHDRFK